jgi:hypothetical protein
MDNLAQNYQPTTTDTNGLDDLFDQGLLKESFDISKGVLVNREGVLPEVAAMQLGLSVSGVLKRLRKGDLPGFKVPARRGEKWMVCATALPEGVLGLAKESLICSEESLICSEESSICSEESLAIECAQEAAAQTSNIDVAGLLRKLEGATYRIGYLESQLEERQKEIELHQQQIKLLTDSQHKPSWWAKFSSWFFKGQ